MKNAAMDFVKDNIYVILGVLCIVVIGIIFMSTRGQRGRIIEAGDIIPAYNPVIAAEEPATDVPEAPAAEAVLPTEPARIVVHIVGEVNNPGVFELEEGARVDDVLQMAGGETEYADLARVNLAAFLRDAMQIIIPAVGDDVADVFIYEGTDDVPTPAVQASGLVNVNTATSVQLQTLPGIGPALAGNIIEFRENNGPFSCVEELINVMRIGPAILNGIRELVTVGG